MDPFRWLDFSSHKGSVAATQLLLLFPSDINKKVVFSRTAAPRAELWMGSTSANRCGQRGKWRTRCEGFLSNKGKIRPSINFHQVNAKGTKLKISGAFCVDSDMHLSHRLSLFSHFRPYSVGYGLYFPTPPLHRSDQFKKWPPV